MIRRFDFEPKNFTLKTDDRLSLTNIHAIGRSPQDMLENCELSFEDWHGNEACEGWSIDDLHETEQQYFLELFTTFFVLEHGL